MKDWMTWIWIELQIIAILYNQGEYDHLPQSQFKDPKNQVKDPNAIIKHYCQ